MHRLAVVYGFLHVLKVSALFREGVAESLLRLLVGGRLARGGVLEGGSSLDRAAPMQECFFEEADSLEEGLLAEVAS